MNLTLGQMMLNGILPAKYKIKGLMTHKVVADTLESIARNDPILYKEVVSKLKNLGDKIATWEGVSIGLDDITPPKKERDTIIRNLEKKLGTTSDPQKRFSILQQGQNDIINLTQKRKGDMSLMVSSGARGKSVQLSKGVITPLISTSKDGPHDFIHRTSYAEGLTPGSWWNAAHEARQNEMMTRLSITVPGDLSKVVANSMNGIVCSEDDCDTENGVWMDTDTQHPLDRFTCQSPYHRKDILVTQDFLRDLKKRKISKVLVRSPTTCEAPDNTICAKCYGLLSNGHMPTVGSNLGVRSAQAIAEPLTQKALDKKHAVATLGDYSGTELTGLSGFKLLTEVPKNFSNKAILAKQSGKVASVESASQGGYWVHINSEKYYIDPPKRPLVRAGQQVEVGDALSTGDVNPAELMKYKGIGQGREYFINMLQANYEAGGLKNFDRRHFENLAKATMNFVYIMDPRGHPFNVGDIVEYNKFIPYLQQETEEVPLSEAVNQVLAQDYYNIKAGTTILPSVIKQLKDYHLTKVKVAKHYPKFKFHMGSIRTAPLHMSNFMGKLGHNHIVSTIKDAATYDQKGYFRTYNPTAAYIKGENFGSGDKGKY